MPDIRLYESVAAQIKRRIVEGIYPADSRLPGERELAEELKVSRVTIREAEIALQAMGYIQIRAGSGAYVTAPAARQDGHIPVVSALELTQARLMFESEAAALAAKAIDDATLTRLGELVDIMSQTHPDENDASLEADREFHLTIAAASGNTAVHYTIESLWRMRTELPDIEAAHSAVCSDEMARERGREHREILEALQARDAGAARHAMQAHFRRLLRSMIEASEAEELEALRLKSAASRQRFIDSHSTGTA